MDPNSIKTILVVDDENLLIRFTKRGILTEAAKQNIPVQIETASDGKIASSILETRDDIHGILSDIQMPHMDGVSLAEINNGKVPMILWSGFVPLLLRDRLLRLLDENKILGLASKPLKNLSQFFSALLMAFQSDDSALKDLEKITAQSKKSLYLE